MRAVVQRVKEARVEVEGREIARIGPGLLVLLGVEKGDGEKDVAWLSEKVAGLRIFEDASGKMNLSLGEVSGEVLVVSNFTLCGDCRRGKRPSFDPAERPDKAREPCERFAHHLREKGIKVQKGRFGAYMEVYLVNDGPVTLILDSRKRL